MTSPGYRRLQRLVRRPRRIIVRPKRDSWTRLPTEIKRMIANYLKNDCHLRALIRADPAPLRGMLLARFYERNRRVVVGGNNRRLQAMTEDRLLRAALADAGEGYAAPGFQLALTCKYGTIARRRLGRSPFGY